LAALIGLLLGIRKTKICSYLRHSFCVGRL